MGYMRDILWVSETTSHLAFLLRLGVMSLNYMPAYCIAIWYLNLIRHLCGPSFLNLHQKFLSNDETFGATNFFQTGQRLC